MTPADPSPLRVRFGEFELDEANALLRRSGQAVDLAPTPFGLLCALARQPGALLTKHTLLDQVWGHRFVSDSVLKTAISDLRSVLADNPREPHYIETVARRGYRFIAIPAPLSAATPPRDAAPEIDEPGAPAFVGRASRSRACSRPGTVRTAASGPWSGSQARGGGQDHAHRAISVRASGWHLRARILRGALRQRRAVSPRAQGAGAVVPCGRQPAAPAAIRGADVAPATALARHRGGPREPAAGASWSRTGPHAARNRRAARPIH